MTDNNFKFSADEMDDIIYAAREARIRFSRLRKCVRRGDKDVVEQWTEESCNTNIEKYKNLEESLVAKFEDTFGREW